MRRVATPLPRAGRRPLLVIFFGFNLLVLFFCAEAAGASVCVFK